MSGTKVSCDDGLGEPETVEITNDYVIVCDGSCYVDSIQVHANGTHVITVKGRKLPIPPEET